MHSPANDDCFTSDGDIFPSDYVTFDASLTHTDEFIPSWYATERAHDRDSSDDFIIADACSDGAISHDNNTPRLHTTCHITYPIT